MDLYDLRVGKIVNQRWVVDKALGEGSCGVVYEVHDILNPKHKAALKVEAITDDNLSVLKKEVSVIKKLQNRPYVVQLIASGLREKYSYSVMTLYGKNLVELQRESETKTFSSGCISRIGIQILYAIKQIHEVGFVHRDPSNMVVGRSGIEKRMFFLIDYGMCRAYAVWEEGKVRLRKPRQSVLFRGTFRYCSIPSHHREEHGRRDDVWGLMYAMVGLHHTLPWEGKEEPETIKLKEQITSEELMKGCPKGWMEAFAYIRSLTLDDRPNYRLIYDKFVAAMKSTNTSFTDPYDWERPSQSAAPTKAERSEEPSAPNVPLPTTDPNEFDKNDIGI